MQNLRTLVVMAKEPEPGRVKTRLCPPLEAAEAASLHEAFVADTLERAAELAIPIRVYGSGGTMPRLRALADCVGAQVLPQSGGHLGCRMAVALGCELRSAARVVVIGADSPDLPLERLHAAFAALDRVPVCIGPARDGGYCLLAVREHVPTAILGANIPWGTRDVLAATRIELLAAGVEHAELDDWSDVDDASDLADLMVRLDGKGPADLRHTRAVLAGFVRRGVV